MSPSLASRSGLITISRQLSANNSPRSLVDVLQSHAGPSARLANFGARHDPMACCSCLTRTCVCVLANTQAEVMRQSDSRAPPKQFHPNQRCGSKLICTCIGVSLPGHVCLTYFGCKQLGCP
jgi:hypothetical protein